MVPIFNVNYLSFQEADEIRQGAGATKEIAGKLRDEADLLANRVATTGLKVSNLEQQATRDEDLTSSAKKNVGQAKSDVSDASKQVQKALEEVDAIIKELNEYSDNCKKLSIYCLLLSFLNHLRRGKVITINFFQMMILKI